MFTKNDKVKVLRKESYWYQDTGIISKVEKKAIRYPISVKFTKAAYNGLFTNNFNEGELVLID